jgi:subtilisin family serine protease
MRKVAGIALLAVMFLGVGNAYAGQVDPNLEAILADAGEHEMVDALVYLVDQVDLEALTNELNSVDASRAYRHEIVVRSLQEKAAATQPNLTKLCDIMMTQGRMLEYKPFWVTNVIKVTATPSALRELAAENSVDWVYHNYGIELIDPIEGGSEDPVLASPLPDPENGVAAVRAPEAWALGFRGEGILVANMDTGVMGDHEALASRWAGVADPRYAGHPEWAWYDPYAGQNDFPYDNHGHGTHTMGSVCGGAPGLEIGVAPGALWMASAPIDRGGGIPGTVADAILSFQWMVDPDGNPGTAWDVPHVCSNSWGVTTFHGYPPCDETFWEFLDACEAAGTVILFSAGNEGTSGLRRPSDRATDEYNVCAVAAVDAHDPSWPIASFSSRGPTYCTPDGSEAIKPDIAAPGVNVYSSWPSGGYTSLSGTSMASPHVNGVAALILQACPNLTVQEVKQIMYDTAVDLGAPGEDNSYGYGMVDAYEAVLLAADMCGPSAPKAYDGAYETGVTTPVNILLQASDYDELPEPITYRIISYPAGATLTDADNGHVIAPGELPYDLVNGLNEVIYTPDGEFWGVDEFQFVADDGGVPPEGGESDPATITVLVKFDAPSITTDTVPTGYLDIPYGPFQLEADQGQPELTWDLAQVGQYGEENLGANNFAYVGVAQNWNDDDESWQYSLPFTFEYYGVDYNQVWVCSNGFLDFSSEASPYQNSNDGLIINNRICPLWDDLRTDRGGDIYIDDSVAGQVTFRWDTVTYSGENQCHHSCTLFADGKIEFNYGPGNTPLTPTVGVSSGDGTRYTLSQYNNAQTLTNADSLRQLPPSDMPDGMYLTTDGQLAGTPTEFGTFEPVVKVTDSLDRSDIKQLTLVIEEEGGVVGMWPPDGAIDARQPSEPDGSEPVGWDYFDVTYAGDVNTLEPGDFAVTELGGDGTPPTIMSVTVMGDDMVRVQLSESIEVLAWTTLTHTESGVYTKVGYLPADVDGDAYSSTFDVLTLIDFLNGIGDLPMWSTDIDRSGTPESFDVLRAIDLLNGGGTYDVYNEATLP